MNLFSIPEPATKSADDFSSLFGPARAWAIVHINNVDLNNVGRNNHYVYPVYLFFAILASG